MNLTDDKGTQDMEKVETTRAVHEYMLQELGPEELLKRGTLPAEIVDVLYETDLRGESFRITEIGSVKNDKVVEKLGAILEFPYFNVEELFPSHMIEEYPLNFDSSTPEKAKQLEQRIERAPWVNTIHAMMKVMNYSKTLSAIQRGEVREEDVPKVIAVIADGLYNFTTESDGDRFTRTSKQFINKEKFPETIMREAGSKGVNIIRHVSMEEMRQLLQVVKKSFTKERMISR